METGRRGDLGEVVQWHVPTDKEQELDHVVTQLPLTMELVVQVLLCHQNRVQKYHVQVSGIFKSPFKSLHLLTFIIVDTEREIMSKGEKIWPSSRQYEGLVLYWQVADEIKAEASDMSRSLHFSKKRAALSAFFIIFTAQNYIEHHF